MFRAATERTLIVAAAFRLRVLLWTIRNRIELPVAGWTRRPRDGRVLHRSIAIPAIGLILTSRVRSGCSFATQLLLGPRLAAVQE